MKTNIIILIVFSLVFHLVSYSQSMDFSITNADIENIIIIKKVFNEQDSVKEVIYTMNGGELSDSELRTRLCMFPSSRNEYLKFENTSNFVDFGSGAMMNLNYPRRITILKYFVAIPLAIPLIISENHHFNKAIKLYNEEIMKLHN